MQKSIRSGLSSTPISSKTSKSNWRQTHEEFIKSIRAAKQVSDHLKNGGRLQDLPPPTPSENPDYVQCPHCLRRFNQTAAERHIPKCATFEHNKPKRPPLTCPSRQGPSNRAPTPFIRNANMAQASSKTASPSMKITKR